MPKNPFPFLPPAAHCITVRMVPTVWPLCHTVPLSAAAVAVAVATATSVELILPVCQCHAPLLVAPAFVPLSLCCASLLLQIAVDTFIWLVSLLIPCKACRNEWSWRCESLSLCDSCKWYEFWDNLDAICRARGTTCGETFKNVVQRGREKKTRGVCIDSRIIHYTIVTRICRSIFPWMKLPENRLRIMYKERERERERRKEENFIDTCIFYD